MPTNLPTTNGHNGAGALANHPADIRLTLKQPETPLDWANTPTGGRFGELAHLRREVQELIERADRLAGRLGVQPTEVPSFLTVDLSAKDDNNTGAPKVGLWRIFEDEVHYFDHSHVDLTPAEARHLAEALLRAVDQAEGR